MRIAVGTAMSIVRELKKVINEDITFMDTSRHIIACTDEVRIGDFHEASQKMLREGLKELIVPDDVTYAGTRGGINLPIEFEDETVAIVGITGEYDKVSRYGQVIKKMTEILLLDDYLKAQKRLERSARNRFLQEWLMTDELRMSQALVNQGLALGIDVTLPRRVAVLALESPDVGLLGQEVVDAIERRIRLVLKEEDARNVSTGNGSSFVVLMSERTDDQAATLVQLVQREVQRECGQKLRAGIDNHAVSSGQLKEGYFRAKKALNAARPGGFIFYDNILLEIFINDIPKEAKDEFVRRIFKGYTHQEIEKYMHILAVLYACDGSITQAAGQLYLHKNTLQYKLNRLTERTGHDPRKLSNAPLFYLAMAFYEGGRTRF